MAIRVTTVRRKREAHGQNEANKAHDTPAECSETMLSAKQAHVNLDVDAATHANDRSSLFLCVFCFVFARHVL